MADWISTDDRLPVPVTAYGPLHLLARQVHRLSDTGRAHEALEAADAYLAIARTVRDEKTVRFLIQGKMYAELALGRVSEAYPLAKGWVLDLVAAIASHKASQDALLTDRDAYKRNMVRTAILLAHPVKA